MNREVMIDENEIVYCTFLKDGRIIKFFLKKECITIYVCEECDSTWFSLEKIFDETGGELLIPYIRSLGYTERINPITWEKIAENNGFLTFEDIKDVINKYEINIIRI